MNEKSSIDIIGAGVNGLSCGLLLLEKGYDVTIYAKDFSPNTTSDIAAAIWVPFHCGPVDKVPRWAADTLSYFQQYIVPDENSGCFPEKLITYFREPELDPSWASLVDLHRVATDKLPVGFVDGYEFESLMMDSSLYMPYLTKLFTSKGGRLIQEEITDIRSFLVSHPLIVNCSGLGSRTLFNDNEVFPSRGQVMRVKPMELSDAVCYNAVSEDLVFVMPRKHDVILGGTAQDNDWRSEVDEADNERMIKDSGLIGAQVSPESVLETRVGFRPSRDAIRLETEEIDGNHVIHNYGHGGGYTLSWGCAMDVLSLAEGIIRQ